MWLVGKWSSEKRSNMQLLPTDESPMIISLIKWSYCFRAPAVIFKKLRINYNNMGNNSIFWGFGVLFLCYVFLWSLCLSDGLFVSTWPIHLCFGYNPPLQQYPTVYPTLDLFTPAHLFLPRSANRCYQQWESDDEDEDFDDWWIVMMRRIGDDAMHCNRSAVLMIVVLYTRFYWH